MSYTKTFNIIEEEKIANILQQIETRVQRGILEKTDADMLIKFIKKAETVEEADHLARIGTMFKRTGLYYIVRSEKDSGYIRYLDKNSKLSITTNNTKKANKLIIGDNYPALKNLLITHKNAIDIIYIDPPYSSDAMGNSADEKYENDLTRDNLLSMMKPRLELARELLTKEGVIFCSIDDKNHAYLKCLFDEVFLEQNFITSFVWQKKKGGGQAKYVYEGHEYVLCYAKDKSKINSLIVEDKSKISASKIIEKNGDTYFVNDDFLRMGHGKYDKSRDRRCHYEEILEVKGQEKLDEVNEKLKDGEYILRPSDTEPSMHYVCRLENISKGKSKVAYSILTGMLEGMRTEHGNNEVESLGLDFSDAKPVALLKILFSMLGNENAVILDFFAGSGTTGQAVLELNKEDGGNRQFILCTNNEVSPRNHLQYLKNNGYLLDFKIKKETPNAVIRNKIKSFYENNPDVETKLLRGNDCDFQEYGIAKSVTAKRLKRVMTGECYDGSTNFEWIKNNEPLGENLTVFEIKEVSPTCVAGEPTPFEVINEANYDIAPFSSFEEKIEWVCQNFERTQKDIVSDEEWLKERKKEYDTK